ncbi:probable jasmonic acid carboxyl methyltransferase 2 [Typha latifolia]|uniref:probable jasmonic acid carboxyl methyltransferase 2 n=1 Tax=Typha latifolia TaxID=4733 RepID=UPI003C2AEB2D
MQQIVRMNSGIDDRSYAKNSTIQNAIVSLTKKVRQEVAISCYAAAGYSETMVIAELGCSSGPNSLVTVLDVIEAVTTRCSQLGRRPPAFQAFLNDLPGNDFNTIFRFLPNFSLNGLNSQWSDQKGLRFVSAVPGNFYGRLFLSKSLHYVHSSSSLHWLSQVPPLLQDGASFETLNKGRIFVSKTSPPCVADAYRMQFRKDFSLFLSCRANELVVGGRMVLAFMARSTPDPSREEDCYMWELLARALMDMVSLGLVEEEKVDSFNAPYYAPSLEEVKNEVINEGSFAINKIELFEASLEYAEEDYSNTKEPRSRSRCNSNCAELMAKGNRAVIECMLKSHFGEDIIEELFERYCILLEEYYSLHKAELTNIVVAMTKI